MTEKSSLTAKEASAQHIKKLSADADKPRR
jgi:hypothetical protein